MTKIILPKKDYRILYADPPWDHYGNPNKMAAAGKHYALMKQEELFKLPIKDFMHKKAVLFLWATGPRLNFALEAIKAWGLHYRGITYVWVKTRKDGKIISGQGIPPTFTKPTTEFVLAATTISRGRPFKIHSMNQAQVILAPRREHSRKPHAIRRNIVELCGDRPRAELFATERFAGWDSWGSALKQKHD